MFVVCIGFQVMFEKYNCAGVYIAIQAVLTLYAQGKSHIYHMILGLLHIQRSMLHKRGSVSV